MSDTNEHLISHADVPFCFTSNPMEMMKRLINVVRGIGRETVVRKVAKNIGFDSFIDSLRSFDSEAFKFRGPRKSSSKDSLICKADEAPDDRLKADDQTNGTSNDQIDENCFYIFHKEIGEKETKRPR